MIPVPSLLRRLGPWMGIVFLVASVRCAAETGRLDTIAAEVTEGVVAFCHPSIIGEYQMVGDPHRFSRDEVKQLSRILADPDTWSVRGPDGKRRSGQSFCLPHYDFKFVLFGPDQKVTEVWLCSHCQQVMLRQDLGVLADSDDMTPAGFARLKTWFDVWFPGWEEATKRDRELWSRHKAPGQLPANASSGSTRQSSG